MPDLLSDERVVVSARKMSDFVAAGVPVRRRPRCTGDWFAPGWATDLWAMTPSRWVLVVLATAARDEETRAALLSIVALAEVRPAAVQWWCEATWPAGPAAAERALGVPVLPPDDDDDDEPDR